MNGPVQAAGDRVAGGGVLSYSMVSAGTASSVSGPIPHMSKIKIEGHWRILR